MSESNPGESEYSDVPSGFSTTNNENGADSAPQIESSTPSSPTVNADSHDESHVDPLPSHATQVAGHEQVVPNATETPSQGNQQKSNHLEATAASNGCNTAPMGNAYEYPSPPANVGGSPAGDVTAPVSHHVTGENGGVADETFSNPLASARFPACPWPPGTYHLCLLCKSFKPGCDHYPVRASE